MEQNETNNTNETNETTQEQQTQETKEQKTPTKNELMRELSKEYGFNLFDAEGLKAFKEFTESQKSEQEKLQETITTLTTEKATWESQKLEYEAQLKAIELGIAADQVKDALKLADGNPDNLAEVIKKYPIFQSKKDIRIGVQQQGENNAPTIDTEIAAYMAKNPSIYGKK